MSDYLEFVERPASGTTQRWDVVSKSGGYSLGEVKWYGRWRQYTFHPEPNTIWNDSCLAAVQVFLREQNAAWRAAQKARR